MTGHTKGPWTVERIDEDSGFIEYQVQAKVPTRAGWVCVASVVDDREAGEHPAVNDARLIAAAPDLLEAARQAQSALDSLMGDSDLDDDDSAEMRAMQALSAAIDKAEGGAR